MAQSDLFPLFWAAENETITVDLFTEAFESTGIHPRDADIVLKKFRNPPPDVNTEAGHITRLTRK